MTPLSTIGPRYPAQIKRVITDKGKDKVRVSLHFVGWSTRYDCKLPLDRKHVRIAPPDIFACVQNGKGAFHKVSGGTRCNLYLARRAQKNEQDARQHIASPPQPQPVYPNKPMKTI